MSDLVSRLFRVDLSFDLFIDEFHLAIIRYYADSNYYEYGWKMEHKYTGFYSILSVFTSAWDKREIWNNNNKIIHLLKLFVRHFYLQLFEYSLDQKIRCVSHTPTFSIF